MKDSNIKELAVRVKRQKINNRANTAILIGAGCSVSAGIPTCDGMMKDMESRFKDYVIGCDEKTYEAYMRELSPSERKSFLAEYISNAKLNLTHIFLASLVRSGYIDCVITTNFDNLALKALTSLNVFPAVYDLASSERYIPGMINFPAVIYLHGQHTGFWQMNTGDEMTSVESSIGRAFDEILQDHMLISVGYGGNDPVFDVLRNVTRFNHNAFWVSYKDKGLPGHVKKELFNDPKKSIYHLPGYDADKFFYALHNELMLETPDLFTRPFKYLDETYGLLSKDLKLDDKPYDLTGIARGQIEEAEKLLAGKQPDDKAQSGKNETSETSPKLLDLALESWLGWKKNDPDTLYETVLKTGDELAREYLANAYIQKGNDIYDENQKEKALEQYSKAIELTKNDEMAYYNRANVYRELEKPEIALRDYNKAIELKSDNADTYNNRGNAYADLKKYDLSLSDYTKAIELNPQYVDAFYNRGLLYQELEKHDLAIADYTRTIELNPGYAEAFNNRGIIYQDLKKHELAIADYTRAIELKPGYAEAYNNRGNAYLDSRKEGLAIADYTKAIELNPQYVEAFNNRGNAYLDEQKNDLAIADYTKAVELKPDYTSAYYNRGNTYIKTKKYLLAVDDFSKVIALTPDDVEAYNNRANAYASLKMNDLALADYSKVIALNPEIAEGYNSLGVFYYDMKKYDTAIFNYNKAVELNENYAEAYYNLGVVYDDLKKYDTAKANYDKAIELNASYAEAYNNRANTLRMMGNITEAIKDVLKAIELDPQGGYPYSTFAEIQAAQGNDEAFYENTSKAFEMGCPVWEFLNDPVYDRYKNEPRFITLLEKYQPK